MDKTEQDFSFFDEVMSGEIYIGGGESHTMCTIAQTIKHLQDEYPQIHYHLLSGYSYDITEYLDKGLLDFGVLFEPIDLTKYDHIRLPLADTWGLLMRKDHPLAAFPTIRAEQLEKFPLLCSKQMLAENGLSGDCNLCFRPLSPKLTSNAYVVWKKYQVFSKPAKKLLEQLQQDLS